MRDKEWNFAKWFLEFDQLDKSKLYEELVKINKPSKKVSSTGDIKMEDIPF